jgi:4-hydroxybenzoate polyprenyltransferase
MSSARLSAPSVPSPVATAILSLVHSNLLISLSATSVAVSTMVLADLDPRPIPLFIVFAVTLFVYSFNRITDLAEDERNVPRRAAFVRRYGPALLAVGGVLYLGAIAVAVVRNVPGAPAMVLPLFVAVLYSVVGLKRVLFVKNLLVGLSWGLIPLGVGVYYRELWTVDVLFTFAFVTTVLTIAAVVFDIKDIEGDREEGIETLPVVAGPRRTRRATALASALVGYAVVAFVAAGAVDSQYLLLLPFVGYMIGYCLVATPDRTPLFYGFVVDVEHILLAVLLAASASLPGVV